MGAYITRKAKLALDLSAVKRRALLPSVGVNHLIPLYARVQLGDICAIEKVAGRQVQVVLIRCAIYKLDVVKRRISERQYVLQQAVQRVGVGRIINPICRVFVLIILASGAHLLIPLLLM